MPRLNSIKMYIEGGVYHLYNRGVNREAIFHEARDYHYFICLLQFYLTSSAIEAGRLFSNRPYRLAHQDLHSDVELIAYTLMPNHFHLIIRQISQDGMILLMKRVSASYSAYFNRKYDRTGHLFEASYQAVFIQEDDHFRHVLRYVHQNPLAFTNQLEHYEYSSYQRLYFLQTTHWMNERLALNLFNHDADAYRRFVESSIADFKHKD